MCDKKIYFFILSVIIFIVFIVILFLYTFYYGIFKSEKDFCLDTGVCKKGLNVNTEYGLIEINEQNCLKYGWTWIKDIEYCKIR